MTTANTLTTMFSTVYTVQIATSQNLGNLTPVPQPPEGPLTQPQLNLKPIQYTM